VRRLCFDRSRVSWKHRSLALMGMVVFVACSAFTQERSDTEAEYPNALPHARTFKRSMLGLYGSAGLAWSSVPANGVIGAPTCCTEYTDNSGLIWQTGLRYSVDASFAEVVLSAGLLHTGVTSTVDQTIGRVFVNGSVRNADVTNELVLSHTAATFGVGLDVDLSSTFEVSVGIALGLPIQQTYSTRETLRTSGAVFENGTTSRNVANDVDVKSNAIMILPHLGLRMELPISDGWQLVPNVSLQLSPVSSSSNLDAWTWFSGQIGFSIERSL
jgi:hypothetical protein